jgi:hypothetical protein
MKLHTTKAPKESKPKQKIFVILCDTIQTYTDHIENAAFQDGVQHASTLACSATKHWDTKEDFEFGRSAVPF